MRPIIRQQALAALEKWQRSEMILSGSEQKDLIELTVIGATGLPKSNFRTSNAWVKIVHYGPHQHNNIIRTFELKTDVSKATQNPVWNKTFLIEISNKSKVLDFEMYDRMAMNDKQLCKYRLVCSFVPGVEANFANRSLLYGFNGGLEHSSSQFC
jgi:Ca2+-dependent lipid-binding protein